jgi:hypothetical protein
LTQEIREEDLPDEAKRYRYRLRIERGSRIGILWDNLRKREREREAALIAEDANPRLPKRRQRDNVIELSSEPDERPVRPVRNELRGLQHPRTGSGRQISPVSVSSTEDESAANPFEELDDEVFEVEVPDSEQDDDLVDTSLDEDDVEITGGKFGSTVHEDTTHMLPESSGTTGTKKDKGKGKAVLEEPEPILDLQEELECFICCLSPPLRFLTVSINLVSSSRLFTMWSRRMWTVQYFPLIV